MAATPAPSLSDFPHTTIETLRYADMDLQGHINNAVYSTLLESGRVALLMDPRNPLIPAGYGIVIVKLMIEFRTELHWPGDVVVASGVTGMGRSSITMVQAVFNGSECAALSHNVIVLTDQQTRKSAPLPDMLRARLESYRMPGEA